MAVEYRRYIRSPRWRAKRAAVILRARGLCERCHTWPIVNVHHLSYDRLGDERPEDLLGVCVKCHEELHGG
jgi:5-methylcytosine-specific restriction endonuclease McrA